ncbi:MAG: ComEC/Rec2 family competence protein [Chloroflexota bacterium]|nr:ComEC/Rec2 family competence protein [Chloroflexota bacterium]
MPLLWLSLAFLGGVLLGEYLKWSLIAWLILAAVSLLLFLLRPIIRHLLKRVSWKPPQFLQNFHPFISKLLSPPVAYSLLLLFLTLGATRYQFSQPKIDHNFIAWYNDLGVEYVVEGLLEEPPDVRDYYTNLRLRVEQIHPVGDTHANQINGTLLARVSPGDDWSYGDRLRLQGEPQTPSESETFSYRGYLARQGIYSYMSYPNIRLLQHDQGNLLLSWIFKLKEKALEIVYQLYPDPEASLLAGILLGVESGIPDEVDQAFRDTGTSHIIAISGFNITIIAGLLATLFGRLIGHGRKGARLGALIALIGIVIYTILVGGDAAVVRAAIMGGLTMLAMQIGRRQDGLNSLAIVAALMALHDPNVLWDVGFQLSFAATLGLVLYAEPFTNTFVNTASRWIPSEKAQRLSGPVGEYLLFTIAASLMTLPIILYHFQRLSLISFIANPLILPAQPPVMILGGLAVILGLIYQPLGQLAAYLAWPFVVYTIRVVEVMAKVPRAAISIGKVSLLAVVAAYALMLIWTFTGARVKAWFGDRNWQLPSRVWLAAAGVLGVLAILVWRVALSAPDGKLHMTVLDVGTGDGILIQTPTGRQLLIDGGPSPSRLSDALGRRLPFTQRELDWLVVAAAGDEQLASLPSTLVRFPPANVLWSGQATGSRSARFLREYLVETGIPIIIAQTGQMLDLGEGATLEVLAATPRGSVLLLKWGNFRTLLPVGLDFEAMDSLLEERELTTVTAMLLAESGFAPVNTREWIARWNPQVLLLSVDAGDREGLPDPQTLQAVEGYPLLRTDENGWIHLSTDGEQMWVEVEKR